MNGDQVQNVSEFLDKSGWGAASRTPLAGDASNRRYERLVKGRDRAVLMIAKPGSQSPFVNIAKALSDYGYSAPGILSADVPAGFLLLEDLGDDLFARIMNSNPALECEAYEAATDVLVKLRSTQPPDGLARPDPESLADMTGLAHDFYVPADLPDRKHAVRTELAEALDKTNSGAPTLALRDFHAENLIWLPERAGLNRVGLLDFQDAQLMHPAYDLISLTQDARRDLGAGLAQHLTQRFIENTGANEAAFLKDAATIAAQRNLRILGIFARLAIRDKKPAYIDFIPRVWNHLMQDLAHPHLSQLRKLLVADLPPPGTSFLQSLRDQCRTNLIHS